MIDPNAKRIACELTGGHEFRNENELFDQQLMQIVNYRMVCQKCGVYCIAYKGQGYSSAIQNVQKGVDYRMIQYWEREK